MEFCDPCEGLVLHAHRRIHVGFALTAGGDRHRQLACSGPVRSLVLHGLEGLTEHVSEGSTEDMGHQILERGILVVGFRHLWQVHGGIVGPCRRVLTSVRLSHRASVRLPSVSRVVVVP